MSVRTTADDLRDILIKELDELNYAVDQSRETINRMFDPNTWGSENWTDLFINDSENFEKELYSFQIALRKYRRALQ